MSKYLVLFKVVSSGREQQPTVEEHKAWLDWKNDCGEAIVDFGGPTAAVQCGSGSDLIGYSVVQAGSLEAVQAVLETNPHHRQGGIVEVHEILEVAGG